MEDKDLENKNEEATEETLESEELVEETVSGEDTDENSEDSSDTEELEEIANTINPEALAEEAKISEFGITEIDMTDQKTDFGLMRPRTLELEMQESYLDYAMSVIVARALPDVRDGLKPVHRRVLYSMHELGLNSKAKYRKSALVVGDVLGKYHPHGDIAVYDTLVRLAQTFSMRYPLVDGQGNFGSVDGDSAAAMRYTECKMAAIAEEMMADIDKDTVDFVPNYDGSREEPRVLPSKLPNLLLNGTMGIAVGMSTNIPPHNLCELVDGTVHVIDNPDCTVDDIMQFVKGPDFPTAGEIFGLNQIRSAYTTGKGSIVMRAVANIEELKKGGFRIVISELPYQVNKSDLVSKIADLVKDKKLDGISGLRDESDRTEGVRVVIDLKSTAYPKKILNRLYELTNMQTSFHVNLLALVDGIQPRVLNIKNIFDEYIKHRQNVVRRRTEFELQKAKDRAHILEGLLIALKNIDEVVAVIRKSKNRDEAKEALISKFVLTDIQANAILDMRLSALAALEVQKIEEEYQEKLKLIKSLEEILASDSKILAIIKKELLEIKAKYPSPRRTKVYEQEIGKFKAEDLIPQESVVVMISRGNYIKRMPVTTYRSQIRGGKGVIGMETKEEDTIEYLISADTHDDILFFTDRGRIFQTKVYEIPAASRISKGQAIVNILQISPDEKVTAVIAYSSKEGLDSKYFVMATVSGVVKKSAVDLYKNVRKTGIVAIKLNDGDKLKWVKTTQGTDKIFMSSTKGQAIFYNENDIRPMGRSAAGVRGIHLRSGDQCIGLDVISPADEEKARVLVILENGFGKQTPLKHFKIQLRGGMGIKVANVTERTGRVIAMDIVNNDESDVILASKSGQIIRIPLQSIKLLGRDTQGVTVMKMNSGDKVSSVTVVDKFEEAQEETPANEVDSVKVATPEVSKDEKVEEKVSEEPEEAKEQIDDSSIEKSEKVEDENYWGKKLD